VVFTVIVPPARFVQPSPPTYVFTCAAVAVLEAPLEFVQVELRSIA